MKDTDLNGGGDKMIRPILVQINVCATVIGKPQPARNTVRDTRYLLHPLAGSCILFRARNKCFGLLFEYRALFGRLASLFLRRCFTLC